MGRHRARPESRNTYSDAELRWLADQLHEGHSNYDAVRGFNKEFNKIFSVRHLSGLIRRNGGSKAAFIEKNVSAHYKLEIQQAAAQKPASAPEKKPRRTPKNAPAKPKMGSNFVPEDADAPYIEAVKAYVEAHYSSETERLCKWTNSDGTSCEEPQDKRGSVYCAAHRQEVYGAPQPEQQEKPSNLRRW